MSPDELDHVQARGLVQVGHYRTRRQGNDRALVVLAAGMPYWLVKSRPGYVLLVDPAHAGRALDEISKFEAEEREQRRTLRSLGDLSEHSASLFFCAWVMSFLFMAQSVLPPSAIDAGSASAEAIMRRGEWWRAITALTLHGDLSHFLANLAFGLLFARFLLPLFGSGLTWSGALLSGAGGNLLNAWFYREETHVTIGASTAVFGEIGMLVAYQILSVLLPIRRVRIWEIILPAGAGLAFLAYLGAGAGDGRTDYMAHFWGLTTGVIVGAVFVLLKLDRRLSKRMQLLLGAATAGALLAAWAPVWKNL